MRLQAMERDKRQIDILAMRDNDYEEIAPGIFPEDFQKPLVANLIDTAAHDVAEVMAPLPSFSCSSSSQTSDTQKKFANKRGQIANSYVQRSRLADQMYLGADRYTSFGYMTFIVDPDFEDQTPFIRVDDSMSSYFACDSRDRVMQFVTIMRTPTSELCTRYPQHEAAIKANHAYDTTGTVEVAEWRDKTGTLVILLQGKEGILLDTIPNILDRVPVRIVKRPNIRKDEVKGQFDDVIWVQVARAMVAAFTMSAVQQSVEAPIAIPNDVQELEFGPYATLQSNNPEKIGRIPLNLPQGLFPEQQVLAAEQRTGSRYPEGRSGNIDASIITGQGVQALMGTFDTQIQTFQRLCASALEDVVSMCFEMDEKLWPNVERSVRIKDEGSPVEVKYKPSKDIANDHSVDVSYGAVAGLDPNRSLIFILQAMSGNLMSKETGRKYLPVDLDHVAETTRMDMEAMRDSLLGGVAAMTQAIPQMAAAGQDPRQLVTQYAEVMELRNKGMALEDAVAKVFAPKVKEPAPGELSPEQQAAEALAAAQGGGAPASGPTITGPQSVGQDLLMGLAGITPGGQANLQSNVSTRQAI